MKTIAQQLGVKEFPFIIKNSQGDEIYYEYADGSWFKYVFDAKGNLIYSEHSDGSWFKREFDAEGNEIYSENSEGYWSKREYNLQGNLIYYENSKGFIINDRNIPEYTMEELIEKIGPFKLKTK